MGSCLSMLSLISIIVSIDVLCRYIVVLDLSLCIALMRLLDLTSLEVIVVFDLSRCAVSMHLLCLTSLDVLCLMHLLYLTSLDVLCLCTFN